MPKNKKPKKTNALDPNNMPTKNQKKQMDRAKAKKKKK